MVVQLMKKFTKFLLKTLLIVVVLPVPIISGIFIYSAKIEPNLLITKTFHLDELVENINTKKDNEQTIKVVQFTDTQLGKFYDLDDLKKVVKKINKQEPDIIVFTGDLIDNMGSYQEEHLVSDVLNKLQAKYGKFAIYGNHDYGGGAVRYYEDIMNKSGFKVLANESATLEINGETIRIFGADDGLLGNYNPTLTIDTISKDDTNILLVHEPDLADDFKEYPIDVILSGHSHGGQVYIPFYGPIKKNILSKIYSKGLYDLENERDTQLFVSSGLGNIKVPFRMFNVPHIVVFNI